MLLMLPHESQYLVMSIHRTLHDNTDRPPKTRHNLEYLKGFLKHNKRQNGLFLLLSWPLWTRVQPCASLLVFFGVFFPSVRLLRVSLNLRNHQVSG